MVVNEKPDSMERLFDVAVIALALLLGTGCKNFNTLSNVGKKNAQGSPYEVLVVCAAPEWEGEVGQSLRPLLERPVAMLNQSEPMFSVLRVTPNDFKNMLPAHRNIIEVVVSPEVTTPSAAVRYDVEAAPQIIITLQGPTRQSLSDYIDTNGESLLYVLEMAERDRTIRFAERHEAKTVSEAINNKFGIEMKVPQGYDLRNQSDNFVWASYEFPTASQGFFIYSYPYQGKGSLTASGLVHMRNLFASRIPGPSDGSYMTTVEQIPDAETGEYTSFEPEYRTIKIGDRPWIEMRGLWDVENDFMGGPFVSYTTIDELSGRVLTLDCYVYSPKLGKRNYLRALEHLVYLIDFPSEHPER